MVPLLPGTPYDPRFSRRFAQPSGLSSDGKRFVCVLIVKEARCGRCRSIPNGQKWKRWFGLTGTLFDFGDKDGSLARMVRLQHPLDCRVGIGKALCCGYVQTTRLK